jgi:hypothetical protein
MYKIFKKYSEVAVHKKFKKYLDNVRAGQVENTTCSVDI